MYDTLMSSSHSFGTDPNLDIMTFKDSYCGSNGYAQNGAWFLGVTSGGADAFSLSLSSSLIQGKTYSLSFYDRQSTIDTTGSQVQIGISNTDSTMGTILYTGPLPQTCQWIKRSFSFVAPANSNYITVTCPYDGLGVTWTHVDNFVLDTGDVASIPNITIDKTVNIFPNPASTNINIVCSSQFAVCSLQLCDILGNTIKTQELNNKETIIDVSSLNDGVYFLTIKTSRGIITKKIIVQH
jgi:hypothetical protein